MSYAKTSVPLDKGHVADPLPEAFEGREAARNACEDGYPAWLPEELRPAHGFMVGIVAGAALWGLVILLAMVIA